MKTIKMSSKKPARKDLISVAVVILLIVFASNKYGIIPVLKGLGIFTMILIFNLSCIRIYQEVMVYLKTKSFRISPLSGLFLAMLAFGIPIVFVFFLKDTYLILGFIISLGVLGGLFIYRVFTKILSE